ncbi:MAG: HAMP domain-containing sensor histidine kinase [Gammaproteobacteria bacterium]|nr:HAMP domain-containing sensor histidine kinase [Gammaproteobacteria bacterium]
MKGMHGLSFSHRVPIQVAAIALGLGVAIAATVMWHDYRVLRADAAHTGTQMGHLLARAVAHELAVEDTWQAYRTLRSAFAVDRESWLMPAFAVVVDAAGTTLIASDAQRFPLARPAVSLGGALATVRRLAPTLPVGGITHRDGEQWYRLVPVLDGDRRLGTLVLGASEGRLMPRFYQSSLQVLVATVASLVFIVPLGWWLGWRIARPLRELEDCVARLGDADETPPACPVERCHGDGEIGRLRARIESVAIALAEKRSLERQVVRNERQAALGRLAAGVAHEINNPLGGMLTALATLKRHGDDPAVARRTVDLLERGLEQIRHIVAALLVEVRSETRHLTPRDMEDVRDLVAPRARDKELELAWENTLGATVPVPGGPIRQVMLNLLINAIQATPTGGAVRVSVTGSGDGLRLQVANTGPPIPEYRLERLFEPFTESQWDGNGLGLWITHGIVTRLHGRIQVESGPVETVFQVWIPVGMEVPDEPGAQAAMAP